MASTPDESLGLLLDRCFKDSVPITNDNLHDYAFTGIPPAPWHAPSLPRKTIPIIQEEIKSFKSGKAPGPDHITPKMLKHFPPSLLTRLSLIFDACWFSGYTPTQWLESQTIFIPKEGKHPTSPKSQRPIGLLSLLFKLFEKLIHRHLKTTVLKDNPLDFSQHGFRNHFSTETALHDVVGNLENTLKKRMVGALLPPRCGISL